MSKCQIFAKTDRKESILYKELERILGEEEAISVYNKVGGDNFISAFGDYNQAFKDQYAGDANLPASHKISTRVNDQGQPKLTKKIVIKGDKVTEYEQYYFTMPGGAPKYINKVKFPGMSSNQSEEVSKMLLNAFVTENLAESFEDLSALNPKEVIKSIENFVTNFKNSVVGNEELTRRADLILTHKDDFKIEVLSKIEELGLSTKKLISGSNGELEEEMSEDEKIGGGINIKESFEVNSKDTAPVRVKLMLSLLPDVKPNPNYQKAGVRLMARFGTNQSGLKHLREDYRKGIDVGTLSDQDISDLNEGVYAHVVDSFLGKPVFANFDDVYGTLQPILSDIVAYSEGSELTTAMDLMRINLREMMSIKPWISGLLDRLDGAGLSKQQAAQKEAQFVQAFSKVRLNFYVTEVDKKNKKYKIINATSTNSRDSKIRGEWSSAFYKEFTKNNILTQESKDSIKDLRSNIKALRASYAKGISNQPQSVQFKAAIDHSAELIPLIKKLGIDITMRDIGSLIKFNGDQSKAPEAILDLFTSIDRTIAYILDPKTLFSVNGENINPFDDQSGIKILSKAKSLFEINMAENNVLANNGKSYFTYSNPSYLHNAVNEWKRDNSMVGKLSIRAFNKNSRWIKYLTNTETNRHGVLISSNAEERQKESKRRISEVEIGLASSFKSKQENDGKDPKEISPIDALNDSISKVLGHKKGAKTYAQTILAADKGRKIEIGGMNTFDSRIDFSDGKWIISNESLNVISDYYEDEYSRMKEAYNELSSNPHNSLKVHYHVDSNGNVGYYNSKDGKKTPIRTFEEFDKSKEPSKRLNGNAFKSQVLPSLSPENLSKDSVEYSTLFKDGLPLGLEDGSYKLSGMTKEQREVVRESIRTSLIERLSDNIKSFDEVGVIHNQEGLQINLSVDRDILDAYIQSKSPLEALSADYFMNSLINTIEYNKLFLGDPAYFKTMQDMIKRTPASYTDGLGLYMSSRDHLYFNQATVSGVEISSRYVDLIRKSLKDKSIADAYDKNQVNSTDAQAWITPKRWKFIKERLGQWTYGKDSHQSAWEKMNYVNPKNNKIGKRLTQKEMKLVAQPMKGVYFEINSGAPVYLKYSQAVLIPQLVNETPMKALYDKMTKDKDGNELSGKDEIHEVVTIDGVKSGSSVPTVIHESNGDMKGDFELNVIQLKNKGWKLQQDLPTKLAHETMVGSQIQKNILAGIELNGVYSFNGEEIKGTELLDIVHKTISDLSDLGKESLISEFNISIDENSGVMKILNKDALYSSLITEFKSRGGSDNIISALEKDMPFDAIPQIRNKVENVFMSMMNKKLTKINTNGGSFIQVSQFGFDAISDKSKSGIKIVSKNYDNKGLRPPYYDEKLKMYMPGQCFLPHSSLLKLLPEDVDWNGISGDELMKMIDPSALKMITYRIPNQGMSSNDAMEIVGILPPGVGDSIIAYDAVPAKTGSDFDIDKMYAMMPHLIKNKETGKIEAMPYDNNSKSSKELQNKLIGLYSSILNSESAYDKVMTSIDASFFKNDIVGLFPETKLNDLTFYSPAFQMKTKFEYLSGKIGVAQTANQLVDHMSNIHENIRYKGYLGLGNKDDKGNTKFDNEYDSEGKYRISDSLSAFLNAYVDIAKDPYISRGNHNGITSGVTFMLLRAGVPIEFVNRFIAQPILSEMTKATKNSEGITSGPLEFEGKRLRASEYVERKFELEKINASPLDLDNFGKYSKSELESTISKFNRDGDMTNFTEEEIKIQSECLAIFNFLQKESKFFNNSVRASKTPDAGDMAQLMVLNNNYRNVVEDGKILGFEKKFEETFIGKYKKNGTDWVRQLVDDNSLFLSANPTLQSTINSMSARTGKGLLSTNEEFIKSISADFYSYAMSGLSIFENNSKDFQTLFKSVPDEIMRLKESKSTNFLIQELETRRSGGINFLKINSKNKPKSYSNKIYRAWIDLLKSQDKAERVLGNRLIRYAFSQSGFKTNLNQFFTYIPHEALENAGITEHIKTVNENMKNLDLDDNFRDQMFRHSADNKDIVQRISTKLMVNIPGTINGAGFLYDESRETKGGVSTGVNDKSQKTYPEFVSRTYVDEYTGVVQSMLYKFIGLSTHDSGVFIQESTEGIQYLPTYIRTSKLGGKFNNGNILEYQYNKEVKESVVEENRLSESLLKFIDTFRKQAEKNGLFFNESMMNPERVTKDIDVIDEDWKEEDNNGTCVPF